MTDEDLSLRYNEAFDQLDSIEQFIWLAGMRALIAKAFDMDTFTAWTSERIARHRAGEDLRVSDLETPAAPLVE